MTKQQKAWKEFSADIKSEIDELFDIYQQIRSEIDTPRLIIDSTKELMAEMNPVRKDIMANCKNALFKLRKHPDFPGKKRLINWKNYKAKTNQALYSSHMFSQSDKNIFEVPYIEPIYNEKSPMVNGFQVLNACFDAAFARVWFVDKSRLRPIVSYSVFTIILIVQIETGKGKRPSN